MPLTHRPGTLDWFSHLLSARWPVVGLSRRALPGWWIAMIAFVWLGEGISHGQGAAVPESTKPIDTVKLRVGLGRSDITPDRPTPMAGYYGIRYSTGTHNPLWAKATMLDDGQKRVVLVTVDLIATTRWMVDETRRLVQEQCGLPAESVMISATHSHTGPMLYEPDPRYVARFGSTTDEAKQYMMGLPEKIAASVLQAESSLRPMTVQHGTGSEPQLAFNRRFFMRDGSVGWNPGKLNPNIVREAGPTDDALPVIAFYDNETKLAALLSSFAIHLDTVGGTQWSADMPFTLEESLQRCFGDSLHSQYATACCGDVNHIDVRSAKPQGGHQEASRIGTRLAGAVVRQWTGLSSVSDTRLNASRAIIQLPLQSHPPERAEWAANLVSLAVDSKSLPPFMEMVEAYRISDVMARKEGFLEAEVQVITLGTEVAWVALPGEIFVQLGMEIRLGSPFSTTSIHELANGSIGYVPTQQAYAQGNYEVISARCATGSGEMLVEEALKQLRTQFQHKPIKASASRE